MGWGLVDGGGAGVSEFLTINPNLDNNNKKKNIFHGGGRGGGGVEMHIQTSRIALCETSNYRE